MKSPPPDFHFFDTVIRPGSRTSCSIEIARLPNGNPVGIDATVVHGRKSGPVVWLSGAIHGDEIIGTEIIRRVLQEVRPRSLRGTLIAVPIVNGFGFLHQQRYLPDGRDLNRSFPGSARGSLAARIARQFVDHVVKAADYGIDFHSGARGRVNLPQIRISEADNEAEKLALAFGAPVIMKSRERDRSLRSAATAIGKPVLVFEGGGADELDQSVADAGAAGTLRVLAHLGMIGSAPAPAEETSICGSSRWIRAPISGLFVSHVSTGTRVRRRDLLGEIMMPDRLSCRPVRAPIDGIVIGYQRRAVVYQGDALVHVAVPDARPRPT